MVSTSIFPAAPTFVFAMIAIVLAAGEALTTMSPPAVRSLKLNVLFSGCGVPPVTAASYDAGGSEAPGGKCELTGVTTPAGRSSTSTLYEKFPTVPSLPVSESVRYTPPPVLTMGSTSNVKLGGFRPRRRSFRSSAMSPAASVRASCASRPGLATSCTCRGSPSVPIAPCGASASSTLVLTIAAGPAETMSPAAL